jgi:hypothetical protein
MHFTRANCIISEFEAFTFRLLTVLKSRNADNKKYRKIVQAKKHFLLVNFVVPFIRSYVAYPNEATGK